MVFLVAIPVYAQDTMNSELFEKLISAINNKDALEVSNLFHDISAVIGPEGNFDGHENVMAYFDDLFSDNFQILSFDGPYPIDEKSKKFNVVYTNNILNSLGVDSDTAEIIVSGEYDQFHIFIFTPHFTHFDEGGALFHYTNEKFFYDGLALFSIFLFSLFVSLFMVLVLLRKKIKIHMISNILSPIIPISLILITLTYFLLLGTTNNLVLLLFDLGNVMNEFDFFYGVFAAIVLGVVPSIISFFIFIRISKFITIQPYGLKLLIMSSSFLFVTGLSINFTYPLSLSALGVVAIIFNSASPMVQPWFYAMSELAGGLSQTFILPMMMIFLIWIPSMLLLYGFYDYKKSRKPYMFIKIIGLIIIFVIMVLPTLSPLVSNISNEDLLQLVFLIPIVPTILLAFLSAEGYFDSIRTTLKNIRNSNPSGIPVKPVTKIVSFVILIIGIIGLAKNIFLIAPVSVEEGSLDTSIIYTIVLSGISSHVTENFGTGKDSAQLIYNSFSIFFGLFWIYDIIMVFRGFGKEFLDSSNILFSKIKDTIGAFSAIVMASLLISLMIFSDVIFEFRIAELTAVMPSWILESLTYPIDLVEIETSSKLINPLVSLSTIAGVLYLVIKMKKFDSREVKNTPLD